MMELNVLTTTDAVDPAGEIAGLLMDHRSERY